MPVRLRVQYRLEKGLLPLDYRRGFASLLKEAIRQSDALRYKRLYFRHHVLKPFTFSVFFPKLRSHREVLANIPEKVLVVGSEAVLYFNTWDSELGVAIYNGLRRLREFPLFADRLHQERILLLPSPVIAQDRVVFRTMAPVLVNTKGSVDRYLLPENEGFAEGIQFAVWEVSRAFLERSGFAVHFRSLFHRRKVIHHYGMCMQGFVGLFEMEAPPQVLNLLYYVGLGVRRSQGFGMLGLVQTASREASPTEETTYE